MNDLKHFSRRTRTPRFEWSAWLTAAFVLMVVAPALHAHEQQLSAQTCAPLYAALVPSRNDQAVQSLESALAVLESVPHNSGANQIAKPQLQRADGSHAKVAQSIRPSFGGHPEFDRTPTKPRAIDAPRLFTSHVVLASALTAHMSSFLSGTRTNRSHE